MRALVWMVVSIFVLCLVLPASAGKGYMGGQGTVVVEEEAPPPDTGGDGGMPGDIEGPLNDNMSPSGSLFGDLYKILRYQGGETHTEYIFTYDEVGKILAVTEDPTATAIGGEPVLSVGLGLYAAEVINGEEVTYELGWAPYPSQCVQPVADFAKWGDIGRPFNTLPLVMTYDATWTRTECAVGELIGDPIVDEVTGAITTEVNEYFVQPMGEWNGVTYCDGVLWADLVDEPHFGRLNLSRAPEAVLQAAFDEAINNINNATSISRDPAGRLVLTTDVYAEFPVYDAATQTCTVELLETTVKAIDSPLENLALYVKLLQDGHLVTPGDEREPIDRSKNGGIPLWKMLELTDGPSADLRPTVDIDKLAAFFPALVDVTPETYYTYYACFTEGGAETPCMCENLDPVQPELESEWVMCTNVVDRALVVVATEEECPSTTVDEPVLDAYGNPVLDENGDPVTVAVIYYHCEGGPFEGLMTDSDLYSPDAADLDFAAAFLAAAAPKYDSIGPDLVVYLNSILGVNKVVGTSEDGLTDYSKFPVYFNYAAITGYDRTADFDARTQPTILVESTTAGTWVETPVFLTDPLLGVQFQDLGVDGTNGFPTYSPATVDFLGFTQMADDNLSTIKLVHTYQIPGLR
ncbi:MAG: hypothetical protein P1P84_08875 [Deferrisomatales bacterium]|nr:hypothetical protein [Deferrisomatales bacterium]